MRIFNFDISINRVEMFLLCGTFASCLFYFCTTLADFKTYVLIIWSFVALSLSVVAIGLLKKSISRKNVSKLRFLYDFGYAAINLLLLDEYVKLALNTPYSADDIWYAVKASSAIIIGCMFGGIAFLLAYRNVLKKVWN